MEVKDFETERQIGEYTVVIPPPPSDPKKILNYGLPANLQKFPYIRPPRDFWSLDSKIKDEFIALQWHYRENGFHFYNNGNIEYCNGEHWFYLTHCHLDTGLPRWVDADRDFFYIEKFGYVHPKSFGTMDIENRKGGKTWRGCSLLLNRISKTKNANGGIQSKTGSDAGQVFDKVIFQWRKMEDYFKPVDIGVFPPKTELVFDTPAKKSTKVKLKDTRDVLQSKIDFKNTKAEAYDGPTLYFYYNDEYGKNVEEDINKTQEITRTCCMKDGSMWGKQLWTSTIEELDAKGGRNAKILWENSKPFNDPNMPYISKTGLVRYFKPCYYGYYGKDDLTGQPFVDEWGYSNTTLTRSYFERIRKQYEKDPVGYRSHVQQFPFVIEEAFYVINTDSQLNLQNIEDQISFNENSTVPLSSFGNLEWIDGKIDNPKGVKFVPCSEERAKWCFSKHPKTPNMQTIKRGKKTPNNGDLGNRGVIGVDPISGVKAFSKRQSDLAMFGWDFTQPMEEFSDVPCFDYVAKTPNPYMGFEDVILTAVYTGYPVHIERNKEALITHMENRGYENYMVKRPSFSMSQKSENKKDDGFGTPNSSEAWRNTLFTALKGVIETRCGFQSYIDENGEEKTRMSMWYLTRSLKALQDFKPNEAWNEFDLAVAMMHAVVLRNQYVAPKVESAKVFKINVPTYKNKLQG